MVVIGLHPFKALQSGVEQSLGALHKTTRKRGESGDFEVIVLISLLLFYYGCNKKI